MNPQPNKEERRLENEDQRPKTEDRFWLIGCLFITAVAAFFRFYDLALKPMHHDEGVNGYFLTTLFREGVYKYDPSNYHGPTLYYIALAFSKVFGLETFSVRASVAVFGVLLVVMMFFLRRYIGAVGSLAAGVFVALSPGMVYISRYFIHEIFFIFCSMGIVLGVLFFIEGRKPGAFAVAAMALILLVCFLPPALNLVSVFNLQNPTSVWLARIGFFAVEAVLVFLVMRMILDWNEGRLLYLMLASASTALFFATKETAFITLGTMLIACICIWIWRKIYGGMFEGKLGEDELAPVPLTWKTFRERLGTRLDILLLTIACVAVFVYVSVVFFSSFFTYAEGVVGAFKAYAVWTKTGSKDHTQNGYFAYAKWLWQVEAPILVLSAVGTLIAFLKARHRFAMFAGLWAYGLFAAYTIIPYKTPWLALSFLLPMCIVAGYGINEMFSSGSSLIKGYAALIIVAALGIFNFQFNALNFNHYEDWIWFALSVILPMFVVGIYGVSEIFAFGNRLTKGLAGLITIAAVGILGYQTYDLNFRRYDDDTMPYVYAHTRRGFLDLIRQIEYYADKSGKGKNATIEIVSPDYWSMPWYLNNYPSANFHGRIVPANTAEMIVAKKGEQDADIAREYAAHYKIAGEYPLRPGVDLILLVHRDLADSDARDIVPDPSLDNFDSNEMQTVPLIEEKSTRTPSRK